MTVEKAMAMDLLDKDAKDNFYLTEVNVRVVDCGNDYYSEHYDDEWDLNDDLKLERFLELENLELDAIEQWYPFFIDIYDGYTEETIRHWYVACTLRKEN